MQRRDRESAERDVGPTVPGLGHHGEHLGQVDGIIHIGKIAVGEDRPGDNDPRGEYHEYGQGVRGDLPVGREHVIILFAGGTQGKYKAAPRKIPGRPSGQYQ